MQQRGTPIAAAHRRCEHAAAAPSTSGSAATAAAATPPRPPWRKILWEEQPYPDNYVDKTFLASVLTYSDATRYDLPTLVKASAVITQQLSTVAIFSMLFLLIYYERLSAGALLCLELLLLLLGAAAALGASRHSGGPPLGTAHTMRACAGQLLLLVGWLLGLSPILATLTRTFSDDTICALTIALFLCHLVTHDYAYASHYSSTPQGTLSLNAANFACVLLAARLPSTTHVFALMSLAVLCFMLLPALSRMLHALPATQHVALRATGALVVLTSAMLLSFSKLLACCYLAAVFTTSLLCPMLLVHLQQYRTDIQGPWDAAVRAFLRAQSAAQT